MAAILIADDEANLRKVLATMLARHGHEVHTADDGQKAIDRVRQGGIDVLITDLRMPKKDGMELLAELRVEAPALPVIMITAHGTVDTAVAALKNGAFDYITKPFDKEELRVVVEKAVRTRELASREHVPATLPGRYEIIGQSTRMEEIFRVIEKVANTPSTVLITGESGTGKELVANALHQYSDRKDKPIIKINCAAIPKNLMESELFGYEKGAFTGAVGSKPGRFELADGGTLFLDEIAEIPLDMQVKLLRCIQESEFERVGGVKTLHVDVRLVVATNRDLMDEIKAGTFREDLFYRLNVVPVELPALRHRDGDIPLLVSHFLTKFNRKLRKEVEGVEAAVVQAFRRYEWPGNIRELENVLERLVLFNETGVIRLDELPSELAAAKACGPTPAASLLNAEAELNSLREGETSMKDIVKRATDELERGLIVQALEETAGNVTKAAKLLKISRKGLQNKMKELGLRDRPVDDEA